MSWSLFVFVQQISASMGLVSAPPVDWP